MNEALKQVARGFPGWNIRLDTRPDVHSTDEFAMVTCYHEKGLNHLHPRVTVGRYRVASKRNLIKLVKAYIKDMRKQRYIKIPH